MSPTRRTLALGLVAVPLAVALPWRTRAATGTFAYTLPDAEWRKKLPPDAYYVLREAGTERSFTSPINDEHRAGLFTCKGCNQRLFSSKAKFDSGTGWPSFWEPLPGGLLQTSGGSAYFGIEVHCARCGGHLGHVFNDGPKPTGLRYCINGVALNFTPAKA